MGLVAGYEDLEDVPEEERDAGEEAEGGRDVLVGAVVVDDVAGGVEDRTTGEEDHGA